MCYRNCLCFFTDTQTVSNSALGRSSTSSGESTPSQAPQQPSSNKKRKHRNREQELAGTPSLKGTTADAAAPVREEAEPGDELYSRLYKEDGANRFSKLAAADSGSGGSPAAVNDFERELSRELRDEGGAEHSDEGAAPTADQSKKRLRGVPGTAAAAGGTAKAALLGVTLMAEDEEQPNGQVQKLLRVPRYVCMHHLYHPCKR